MSRTRARHVLVSLLPLALLPLGAACEAGVTPGTGGSGVGGSSGATQSGGTMSSATMSTSTASSSSTGMAECTGDEGCDLGEVCVGGSCTAGCNDTHGCPAPASCCAGTCFDLTTDLTHCGACDVDCGAPPNIAVTCNSMCQYGNCDANFFNCDGMVANGCESATACTCNPGEVQACYSGPPGTETHAPCGVGMRTCNATGNAWGPCLGQTLPEVELCSDGIDQDCNGTADDIMDKDGDGWTICNGDCCDEPGNCGNTPNLINPGAFEVASNMVDDDCDGTIDNPLAACDMGLASNSSTGLDYAKAIELCQTTTENPPIDQRKWGVISAVFSKADGNGTPNAGQRSIRAGFGPNVMPQAGARFAVLSSGVAAAATAPNNTSPNYVAPQFGQDFISSSPVPSDWLAANGNSLPNAPGCPAPTDTTARDPIMLKVRVRVPTNAQSFSVKSNFYSAEYPEWVCSPFNDFYLTLLDSTFVPGAGQSPNPADKNLAFYDPPPAGAPFYPVGVNLAFGNTGLFSQCKSGQTGCSGQSIGQGVLGNCTCVATTRIVGTGFDIVTPPGPGQGCGTNNLSGGATDWLTTNGNVKPGEKIDLRFVIWDTSDGNLDSTVLIDQFQWSLQSSTPGTHN